MQCLFTADFAPRRRMAGFALGMAVSLAVYLQLIASLSKALFRAHSADAWTAVFHTGRWQEFRADKRAAQCSASYAQGGLDHFSKRMKIDSVLR